MREYHIREFSWDIHLGAWNLGCLGRVLVLKVKIISKYLCHDKLQKLISVILFWVSEWLGAGIQSVSELEWLKASNLCLPPKLIAGGCTKQPSAESRSTLALCRFANEQWVSSRAVAERTHHNREKQCKYCSVWKVVYFFWLGLCIFQLDQLRIHKRDCSAPKWIISVKWLC